MATLVEQLNPTRDGDHHPYFQTLFSFQKPRGASELVSLLAGVKDHPPIHWGGLELTAVPEALNIVGSAFDLVLEVAEMDAELVGQFKY